MTDFVKLGAVLTLIGFLAVGSRFLYVDLAPSPSTPDELQAAEQVAKRWEVIQGIGWIVVGLGLYIALVGSAKSDMAIDTKSEILLERLPPGPDETKRKTKFVCSDCGGDITEDAKVCPHCGSPIEA